MLWSSKLYQIYDLETCTYAVGGQWGYRMAHLAKATRLQVVGLINHDLRKCDNHSNESIVKERSVDNYNLHKGEPLENYNARIEQIKVLNRKDVNTLGELCITLPKELINEPKNVQKDFFESCYSFAREDFGENNLVSAIVHNDETTPHIHIKFIPVVEDKKTQQEKCSMKEKCPREYYQNLHERLQAHCEKDLNRDLSILNGETIENKTIKQLKQKQNHYLEKEIKQHKEEYNQTLQKEKELIENHAKRLSQVIKPDKENLFGDGKYINYNTYLETKSAERVLIKENEKLKKEINDYKYQYNSLEQDNFQMQEQNAELRGQNNFLKKENKKLKNKNVLATERDNLKKQVYDLNNNNKSLSNQIQTLNNNLNLKDKELNDLKDSHCNFDYYKDFYDHTTKELAKIYNKDPDFAFNIIDNLKLGGWKDFITDITTIAKKLISLVRDSFERTR